MRPSLPSICLVGLSACALGCVDVDQALSLRASGAIDYTWKVGLDQKLARTPLVKQGPERETWWKGIVPTALKPFITTSMEDTPDRLWLTVDADLPGIASWTTFRTEFIAAIEANTKALPFFLPPQLEDTASGVVVTVNIPPSPTPPKLGLEEKATNRWILRLTSDAGIASGEADRREGNTLIWDRNTVSVSREGLVAAATLNRSTSPVLKWAAFGAALAALLGLIGFGATRYAKANSGSGA